MSRIDEERHKQFLAFENQYGSDVEQALADLKNLPRTNRAESSKAYWLKEWITQYETIA